MASFFALCAASVILVRFFALGELAYLVIGLGFLVAGTEDLVHGAISLNTETGPLAGWAKFIPGTYVAGRLALVFMLLLAASLQRRKAVVLNVKREFLIYGPIALGFGVLVTVVATKIPLPQFIYPGEIVSRPVDLITGLFYLLAIPLYIKFYSENKQPFLWSMVVSLIFGMTAQIYMVHSQKLYDAQFDLSHLMKVFSYMVPILGVGFGTIFLYRKEKFLTEDLRKTTVSRDSLVKEIAERKKREDQLKKSRQELLVAHGKLDERLKELRCLYGLSGIVEQSNSIEEILQRAVDILTPAWRYPYIACARITFENKEYKTDNFKTTKWKQSADIKLNEKLTGRIEVYYLEEKPELEEGPFLKEERDLLDGIAERLGRMIEGIKTQKMLKETEKQLFHSEKLASIGELAAGVAHEINNPLTAIAGEAEILLKYKGKDKDTKSTLRIIIKQSKRIKALTGSLLEFSRKKELILELADINDVIEKSISLVGYQAKMENIEIIKKLDSNLPKILGDISQLQEVFLNLILNAVQAMNERGKIIIKTHIDKITKHVERRTSTLKLGQKVLVIEFKDTGKGMNKQALGKVFDPFFSTKDKGTGLGLSISYGIIKKHDGVIEAYSELGKGSTFIVKLPVSG